MADLISDGMIRVTWVPTIANIAAPTVAEINAGLRIDTTMTPDGLKVTPATADVDTSALSSTFNTAKAGRRTFDNSITLKKQDTGDTAATTLVYQAVGYLVVRRSVTAGTANTIGDKVEVFPSQCGEPQKAYGPNTVQAYEVPLKMTADPNTNATVA
jgi:hypothetical protein